MDSKTKRTYSKIPPIFNFNTAEILLHFERYSPVRLMGFFGEKNVYNRWQRCVKIQAKIVSKWAEITNMRLTVEQECFDNLAATLQMCRSMMLSS